MIYQLARTSVGLTGQVKWNLSIANNKVSDLQIVPIHEQIPYNRTSRVDTLNYTHVQNLNRLYRKTQGYFFEPFITGRLNTTYPIKNGGCRIDTHENTYEMGLKRCSVGVYNKQFMFFCPFFCDNPKELNNISFYLVIENDKNESIYRSKIDLSYIKNYLQQYIKDTELDNRMIYIDFNNHNSWINGIDVENGVVGVRNNLGLIENLTSQERPLLEVDNMILNQFANNHMVCTQAFNFNFLFDLYDIAPANICSQLNGECLNMYVDMYNGDNKIEVADLYTNYEKIKTYNIQTQSFNKDNVLDYLQDYRCIDLVTQNKIVQNTFHWGLYENNDYLFNLYDGFAPFVMNDGIKTKASGLNVISTNSRSTVYNKMDNPLSWVNPYLINSSNPIVVAREIQKILMHEDGCDRWIDVNMNMGAVWRNGVKMKGYQLNQSITDDYKMMVVCDTSKLIGDRKYIYNILKSYTNETNSYIFELNNHIMTEDVEFYNPLDTSNSSYLIVSKDDNIYRFLFLLTYNEILEYDDTKSYLDSIEYNEDNTFTINNLFLINNIKKGYLKTWLNYVCDYGVEDLFDVKGYKYIENTYYRIDLDQKIIYNILDGQHMTPKNKEILYYINNINCFCERLQTYTQNIVNPSVIVFDKSVDHSSIDTPINTHKKRNRVKTEIEYYNTDKFSYVLRYDGLLCPYFLRSDSKEHNYIYYHKQFSTDVYTKVWSDAWIDEFNSLSFQKFNPTYPSAFWAIKKDILKINKYYRTHRYNGERSWFKKNKVYYLPKSIEVKIKGTSLDENTIKEQLRKNLVIYYNYIPHKDNNVNKKKEKEIFDHYIYPLYDHSYTFDYINNKDIKNYNYTIKYTLK